MEEKTLHRPATLLPINGSAEEDCCYGPPKTEEDTKCTIEEVKPGKFVRKCLKAKKVVVVRGWPWSGKPSEVSTTEETEEDVTNHVTDQMVGQSFNESKTEESEVKACRIM
ncbi:unnamed protein product [Microthlaspi erraticum]|uniref:Uncharacterized protein n=1 Tax=Microthlaspi erraticum TaxID=1685480 RepID=A0A6D2I5H4_9BRAS|nr:unnamed protein product [Microthlaspi erraticum]